MTVKRILELLEDYKIKDNCPIVAKTASPFGRDTISLDHICLALKRGTEQIDFPQTSTPFNLKAIDVVSIILNPGYDCFTPVTVGQFKNYLSTLENKNLPLYAKFPNSEKHLKIINCLPTSDCKELITKETASKVGYDVFVLLF